ncbi:uncharacterized protein IL334_005745 [Kwoniella shivajii]|uniref:Phytanoyl-CoA dioxygenase n=1 Tax=Kwoniella shivajii TaxID=564305 RepID=A0ABZ1D5V7_9TREE|nr:hypothetical protein IL334_005745 [Kwoniella shivajii]
MVQKSIPTIQTVPATAPIAQIVEILHRDGVIVLSDYATEDEIDALNQKAAPHFDKAAREFKPDDKFKGFRASNTTVFYDLIGAVPEDTSKLLQRKVWHQVMAEFLSPETWEWYGEQKEVRKGSYWLHTSIAYKVGPGAGNQVLHRDSNSSMVQRTGPETPPTMVSTFVAGVDVTAKNGGTHVIPGSHLWPQDRAPKQEDCCTVEMKKGSLGIWLGNIFHGAGANTCEPSDPTALRIIYGLFATSDNFRQGENTVLACKPGEYMKMAPEVLKVLGFYKGSSGTGALGGKDPIKTWSGLQDYQGGEWIYKGAA